MEINPQIDLEEIDLPQDPIFIVGFPRSGTTLLQALLATQENLYSLPETHFFPYISYVIREDERGYIESTCLEEVFKRIKERLALKFSSFLLSKIIQMAVDKKLSAKNLFEILVYSYIHEQIHDIDPNDFRWIEKTPNHYNNLQDILTFYPYAQIVCIIRNPIPAIHSRKTKFAHERKFPVERLAHQWNRMILLAEAFKTKYPNQIYMLRYEDLVEKTTEEITSLCEFLNISLNIDHINRYKDIAHKFILPSEQWKDDVKTNRIMNINESSIKMMHMVDILKIQSITQKKSKKYDYEILFQGVQKIFDPIFFVYRAIVRSKRFVERICEK